MSETNKTTPLIIVLAVVAIATALPVLFPDQWAVAAEPLRVAWDWIAAGIQTLFTVT